MKVSIIIPVRNESDNIKIMLNILEATLEFEHEILIVYDSPDDTSIPAVNKMHEKYGNVIPVQNTLGKGIKNAIKTGVNTAKSDCCLVLAIDDMGPVLAVEQMLSLIDKGCDVVSATRYAYGGRVLGGYFTSRLLSKIANRLFVKVCGSAFSDATVGFKMFKKSAWNAIKLEGNPVGWAVAFEFAMKAQLAGMKLGEVPIISINRFYSGKSSFKLTPWVKEYFKWFVWGSWKINTTGMRKNKVAYRIKK